MCLRSQCELDLQEPKREVLGGGGDHLPKHPGDALGSWVCHLRGALGGQDTPEGCPGAGFCLGPGFAAVERNPELQR